MNSAKTPLVALFNRSEKAQDQNFLKPTCLSFFPWRKGSSPDFDVTFMGPSIFIPRDGSGLHPLAGVNRTVPTLASILGVLPRRGLPRGSVL
jgi:hypothetical protein